MIKKGFLVLLTTMVLLGCQDVVTPDKPDKFIDEDKMVDLLYDVSVLKALKTYSVNEMRALGIKPESYIYEKYKIDSLQLAENLYYYSVDFNKYTALWERVNERLTARRDEAQFEQNDRDSIRRKDNKDRNDSLKKASLKKKDELEKKIPSPDSLLESIGD